MYIQQNPLFSFNELMSFQPKSRLELIFSKIDLTPALRRAVLKSHFRRTIFPTSTFTSSHRKSDFCRFQPCQHLLHNCRKIFFFALSVASISSAGHLPLLPLVVFTLKITTAGLWMIKTFLTLCQSKA